MEVLESTFHQQKLSRNNIKTMRAAILFQQRIEELAYNSAYLVDTKSVDSVLYAVRL